MKVLIKKNIIVLIIITMIAMLIATPIQAAVGFSISKGSASLTTGGTTTITITASGCAGKFNISSSNPSVASVSASSVFIDDSSATITVTAKSAGSANINITAADVTDTALNEVTGTKTCVVTVSNPVVEPEPEKPTTPSTNTGTSNTTTPSTNTSTSNRPSTNTSTNNKPTTSTSTNTTTTVKKSDNSNLAKLEIAEGVITPEFNNDVKEYTVNISNEITKLSIVAVADSSKATVTIKGNEELQVGENIIEVIVTAEDGSKTTYKVIAKRAEPQLSLQALTVAYINENGEKVNLILNPQFSFDIYEYVIEEILPHTIENVEVIGTANRENAKIEITGNTELKTGENVITIKAIIQNEAGLEEQKTYTVTLQKEKEPVVVPLTTMEKVSNWFSGVGASISAWLTQNFDRIIAGMLFVATAAFVGLTIYFAYDYKNYQKVLAKLAELNKANLMERVNVALDPEKASNIGEEKVEVANIKGQNTEENVEEIKSKSGKGRRYK